jgi:hypothetical protein
MLDTDHPDYDLIMRVVTTLKLGDLFLVWYHFFKLLPMEKNLKRKIKFVCIILTIPLYIVFRVVKPFWFYPPVDPLCYIMGASIHAISTYWVYLLFSLATKLA